jgi:hypothetical protein
MDKVAKDTTKHKKKPVVAKLDKYGKKTSDQRFFCITPEGDGKMNQHITCALTSHANGMYYFKCHHQMIVFGKMLQLCFAVSASLEMTTFC